MLVLLLAVAGSAYALHAQVRENTRRIESLEKQQDRIYDKVDELWRTLLKKGAKV